MKDNQTNRKMVESYEAFIDLFEPSLNTRMSEHYGKGDKTEQGMKYSVKGVDVFVNNNNFLEIPIFLPRGENLFESFAEESQRASELVDKISEELNLRFIINA